MERYERYLARLHAREVEAYTAWLAKHGEEAWQRPSGGGGVSSRAPIAQLELQAPVNYSLAIDPNTVSKPDDEAEEEALAAEAAHAEADELSAATVAVTSTPAAEPVEIAADSPADQDTGDANAARAPDQFFRAVTVDFLVEFTTRHSCWNLKTYEVVDQVVKPMTESRKCRFVELPEVAESGAVGPAEVFASHAWGTTWGSLISALAHTLHGDQRVWVDCLAILQWPSSEQGTDLGQLGDVIRHANGVVLVVHTPEELMSVDHKALIQARSGMEGLSDDTRRRIPFDRIWCLFEIMTASLAGTPLVMKVGTTEDVGDGRLYFRPAGSSKEGADRDTLFSLVMMVDVAGARAAVESDRVRILEEVKNNLKGFEGANSIIRGAVVGARYASAVPQVQAAACGKLQALSEFESDLQARFGADAVGKTPGTGLTPLMAAAAAGYTIVVRELLRMGAEVDARDASTGRSAAYLAAMGGHVLTLEALLEGGADLLQTASSGASLLFAAVGGAHKDTARWLITRSDGALLRMPGDEKESPIGLAISLGSADLLEVLLSAGADPNQRCGQMYPLLLAASMDRVAAMQQLVDAGADVNRALPDGRTALLVAASKGFTPNVDILLKHGAELDAAHQGMTSLWLASHAGHVDTVARLVSAGANLEAADGGGYTAAWLAAFNGRADILNILLEAGAAVNVVDSAQGTTPLTAAASAGRAECVDVLLRRGADVNKAAKDGRTAVIMAASIGHVDIIRALLAAGADVNAANAEGLTPCILAAAAGHTGAVEALLAGGADVAHLAKDGVRTAAVVAAAAGHAEIANMIESSTPG
eukprot:jgi/Tetstr1/463809/TSEL_008624.t1